MSCDRRCYEAGGKTKDKNCQTCPGHDAWKVVPSGVPCPICGDSVTKFEEEHPADDEYLCKGCGAAWGDGKIPSDEEN